jgi:hypothetical protein
LMIPFVKKVIFRFSMHSCFLELCQLHIHLDCSFS